MSKPTYQDQIQEMRNRVEAANAAAQKVYAYDRASRRFRLMPAKEAADKGLLATVPEDMVVGISPLSLGLKHPLPLQTA